MIPYDKRNGKIWYNNDFVDWSDVKVHVLSQAYTMQVVYLKAKEFTMVQYLN